MFQLSGITKSFGGRTLFGGVSWNIQPGDRVGLVGPNGIGKTTLLRIMTGEAAADEGTMTHPRGATVGYLPQEVEGLGSGTVLETVTSARSEVGRLEASLAELEQRMTAAPAEEAEELAHVHGDLLERYQLLDGYGLESRAREILGGLGFATADADRSLTTLSGGWIMRVALARILLARPDLLLLDEPTNHLDLDSLRWLESFLDAYEGAWVVVSHDRYFLNRMVSQIAELGPDGLFVFPGHYDDYVEARAAIAEQLAKEALAREKRVKEIESFIERFRYKASKARQVQSRVKMLERDQADAPARPPPPPRRSMSLRLPEPPRSGRQVATLKGVRKVYGEHVVYPSLDLTITRGERLALVGENGAGKSTLLKMLAGVIRPDGGEFNLGHGVEQYYFAQHQTEMLNPDHTVVEELREVMPLEPESRVRGILGAFLFTGGDADKPVSVLSGGEKSRLALARMLARPTNLLLLDEPTNHLDLTSRDVLEAALAEFPGTIVFISHDRYFINRLATEVVEVFSGGRLVRYPGDYDYYLWKRAKDAEAEPAAVEEVADGARPKGAVERETRKAAARETARREKQAARLEEEIHAAEARMAEIDALMCDPDVYADGPRCKALLDERAELEAGLPGLYRSWEEASG